MPHQCVHCNEIYPDASKELLEGCKCGSHFFFYVRQEQLDKVNDSESIIPLDLNEEQKNQIEQDVREIMGIENDDAPVILDLESIRVLAPGKFEIDIVNLFNKNKPIIYKLEEGKYIIDIASTLKVHLDK